MTCPQQGKLRGALPTYSVYSWLVWCGSCAEKGLIPPDIHILLLDDKLQCLKSVLGVPVPVTAGLWPLPPSGHPQRQNSEWHTVVAQ